MQLELMTQRENLRDDDIPPVDIPTYEQPEEHTNPPQPTAPRQRNQPTIDSQSTVNAGTSSRKRIRKMTSKMREIMEQGLTSLTLMAMKANFDELHDQDLDLQELMRNTMSFLSEMIGDTMYFHQAMNQPDADEFVKAIAK